MFKEYRQRRAEAALRRHQLRRSYEPANERVRRDVLMHSRIL